MRYFVACTLIVLASLILPTVSLAMPDPEYVEEVRKNAREIVIGEVTDVAVSDNVSSYSKYGNEAVFELRIEEIERTTDQLQVGQVIEVKYVHIEGLPPTGPSLIRVNPGDKIEIALNPSEDEPGYYESALMGDTMTHLFRAKPVESIEEYFRDTEEEATSTPSNKGQEAIPKEPAVIPPNKEVFDTTETTNPLAIMFLSFLFITGMFVIIRLKKRNKVPDNPEGNPQPINIQDETPKTSEESN